MEEPTQFLGFDLTCTRENCWEARPGVLYFRLQREVDVKYTDGSVDPVVYTMFASIGRGEVFHYTEEYCTCSLEDLETYFDKWLQEGLQVAREFTSMYPFTLRTMTGRLSSKEPHISNGPRFNK